METTASTPMTTSERLHAAFAAVRALDLSGADANLMRAGLEVAEIVQLADVVFALAGDGGLGDGEESIGGLAHRGDYDYWIKSQARFYYGGDALDGRGGFDGGAAEFHYDHERS